jgi:hypothetical protein
VSTEKTLELQTMTERWITLAEAVHAQLVGAADEAMKSTEGMSNWAPETVAVRLLLRSCRNLQGVLLLCRQRLVVESRTLARSIIENSFGVAALLSKPDSYLKMLREDSEESRRRQGKFILDRLPDSPGDRDKLRAAIATVEKGLDTISPKRVAELGVMLPQYLTYQRLSDDSAHATAKALQHHVKIVHGKAWTYRSEPGSDGQIAATVHHALLAALSVGIGATEHVGASAANRNLRLLAETWRAMPPVELI